MWRPVQHLDRRLMKRSFSARSPALDHPLVAITQAANYSRLWLLIAGALAVFGGRRGQRAAGRGLIGIAIAGGAMLWGGELTEFGRRACMIGLVVSVLVFAAPLLSSAFGVNAAVV